MPRAHFMRSMEQSETHFFRKLLFLGTAILLSHFALVIWHLLLLVKVQPSMPTLVLPLLIVVNIIPLMALIAFWRGWRRLAGWMVIIPLGVALVIGCYTHFLSGGTDSVFRMPPGEWRSSFQVSAVMLAILEALGCWVGFQMVAAHKSSGC